MNERTATFTTEQGTFRTTPQVLDLLRSVRSSNTAWLMVFLVEKAKGNITEAS